MRDKKKNAKKKSQTVGDIKTPFVNPVNEGDQSRIGRHYSPDEMILTNGRVIDTRRARFPPSTPTAFRNFLTHIHTHVYEDLYRRLNGDGRVLYMRASADESVRRCFRCRRCVVVEVGEGRVIQFYQIWQS